jgi:hypothetical protein
MTQQHEQDQEHFDCILLGTGLQESILSAALSKAGLKVLHLDDACFYGRHLAAFPLDQLLSLGIHSHAILKISERNLTNMAPMEYGNRLDEIDNAWTVVCKCRHSIGFVINQCTQVDGRMPVFYSQNTRFKT